MVSLVQTTAAKEGEHKKMNISRDATWPISYNRRFLGLAIVWFVCVSVPPSHAQHHAVTQEEDIVDTDPSAAAAKEGSLISNARQLTFEGRRAGEGYFGSDGSQMVFQSERDLDNPFFQIYLMDFETGDVRRVSPGYGKTTCAWIHPDGNRVLFASTHEDKDARQKQKTELKLRQEGKQRRYSWDYDEHYEIYEWQVGSEQYRNLTNAKGYDAEGSWSPDGNWIAFTSNRRGYGAPITEADRTAFEQDPAYLNDIYLMKSDGSELQQLTDTPGYDGGPFFSPDGQRICWRRFSPDGALAEIMTMRTNGSDQRQLTRMGAMSWAPFYHPSGRYLIFTTNRHGFANFELYLVDTDGKSMPVRVTYTKGFDGLPVFTPDGQRIAWTTNRTSGGQSQIFLADWNHERAMQLLGLEEEGDEDSESAVTAAHESSEKTSAGFSDVDIMRHVDYLCRPELEGRLTGTPGERMATAYVAAYLDSLGLIPAGDNGEWFQPFDFTAGVDLGTENRLTRGETEYELQTDWIPVPFSKTGLAESAEVVFAGYGIAAPAEEEEEEYDSFVHLDVQDKWILVFRYMPEDISAERRQQLSRFTSLRYKAMVARDKGARGLIVVSGPNSGVKHELTPFQFDGSLSGASVPVISISDAVAEQWLEGTDKSLKQLQDDLDNGQPTMGFPLEGVEVSASIDIQRVKRKGRNVLGRLPATDHPTEQYVVIGAHVDHLGKGPSGSSLARDAKPDDIHFGADDNASGVAAMLEVAEYLAKQAADGRWQPKYDVLFAAWSGEELGLVGSNHFLKAQPPTGGSEHGAKETQRHPQIVACLNMDMVGRLDKKLILQGVGSSSIWKGEIEKRNAPIGLPITLQKDSYIPTDASAFYLHGVPILSAFTGSHSEYHTPRDTPDTLNYEGAAKIARFMGLVARSLAAVDNVPDYQAQTGPKPGQARARMRAYLGTIPDYTESELKGVKLSGVSRNGPAAAAGVQGGDVIVGLAGKKIENIYDYTYAIEALKIGQPVDILVQRNGKEVELKVIPGSRE